jgi:hypothetical protein
MVQLVEFAALAPQLTQKVMHKCTINLILFQGIQTDIACNKQLDAQPLGSDYHRKTMWKLISS